MKTLLMLSIFLLNGMYCFSQKNFTLKSEIGSMAVKINGIQYQLDSIGTKINTKFPTFDTLVFLEDGSNSHTPIICNFKPDSAYTISFACCGSLDVFPTSKQKNDSLSLWNYDTDFYKIQNELMDQPFISIKTLNHPKDSIYAWHADAACETEHRIINKTLWKLGIPPKCFFWSNITYIQFFKTDHTIPKHKKTDLEEFLDIDNIVELTSISFRLFDDERFVIIYDEKKNQATLQYEKEQH